MNLHSVTTDLVNPLGHDAAVRLHLLHSAMRLRSLFRRALNLNVTTIWSSLWDQLHSQGTPTKHIKIDDEECHSDKNYTSTFKQHTTIVSILKMLFLLLSAILLLVVIIAYTVYKPPTALVRFFQWYNPDVLFHVPLPASSKTIALSFDDAPSTHTARILDLLQEHNFKATFFIIGSQTARYPQLLRRIVEEGHELGNHAWNDEPSFQLPLSELERQIGGVEAILPVNRNGAKYFRPGSGFFNQGMVELMGRLGYRMVLGSIYPHDPQIHHPRMNAKHVLSMLKPGGIVIMHDRRDYSAEQVELVLKGLREKGWQGMSVGGLLEFASGKAS